MDFDAFVDQVFLAKNSTEYIRSWLLQLAVQRIMTKYQEELGRQHSRRQVSETFTVAGNERHPIMWGSIFIGVLLLALLALSHATDSLARLLHARERRALEAAARDRQDREIVANKVRRADSGRNKAK